MPPFGVEGGGCAVGPLSVTVLLASCPGPVGAPRRPPSLWAYSVSRSVGPAVVRNRVRRRLRHAARDWSSPIAANRVRTSAARPDSAAAGYVFHVDPPRRRRRSSFTLPGRRRPSTTAASTVDAPDAVDTARAHRSVARGPSPVGARATKRFAAGRPSPCRFVPSCSTYALEALEIARRPEGLRPRGAPPLPVPSVGWARVRPCA